MGAVCHIPAKGGGEHRHRHAQESQDGAGQPYIPPRASGGMQAAEEVARGGKAGGSASTTKQVQITMPDAEVERLFISLIDPTAMARTDRCIHIAELIGAYSAGARWDKGVRLARTLEGMYEDMSKIADMPRTGDTYWGALHAMGDILAYLRKVGRAYRDGRDADPMDGLEETRASVARMRKMVLEMEIEEPYSEPAAPDTPRSWSRRRFPQRLAGSPS